MASVKPTQRRTKIIATIGPASATEEQLLALANAGMDGARLNFSHGTREQHAERARLLRAVQERIERPISLIADLQGPKLRIGELPEAVLLRRGDEIVVVGEQTVGDGELPVLPSVIGDVLRPGHQVLIDDGLVRLEVEANDQGRVRCAVLEGGEVSTHKGVNVPGVPVPIPALTRKDLDDLEFALVLGVDFVALSFVRSAADLRDLSARIKAAGSTAHVIAKIEKAEAVESFAEILTETDAVMVARGDLGVEIGVAAVPLVQKRIILESLEAGKPVITATQMLESMIHHAEPTRAEASDVANAVLDGTSSLMLSGETAVGKYPIEAVAYMDRIARAVEPSLGYRHQLPDPAEGRTTVGQAMSNAACDLAEIVGACASVVPTETGGTASAVARLRPRRPIIGLTHNRYALQQMAIEWGVKPMEVQECGDVEELWSVSLAAARRTEYVEAGDRVVITAGTAVNVAGSTNVIKVDVA
jgi:pyruvate kinase